MSRNPVSRINSVAQAVRENRRAIGFHLTFPSPEVIEILGKEGFEFVYLDAEHGSFELPDIDRACCAAILAGITVLVRVPYNDPVLISRYLDLGVQGIIVPHVSSASEARKAVDACYYLPKGKRSYASARVNGYRADNIDFSAYFAAENRNVTLTVQIEDIAAIAHLDEILGVEGIDYFTIGKHDLATSMGVMRTAAGTSEEVNIMVEKVKAAIAERHLLTKDDVMIIGRVRDFLVSAAQLAIAGAAQ